MLSYKVLFPRVKDSLPETHSLLGRTMLLSELTAGDSEDEDLAPSDAQPPSSLVEDPAEPPLEQAEEDTSKR